MRVQCEACGHVFPTMAAKCEDWSAADKSFICPACDTCLRNPYAVKLFSKGFMKLLVYALAIGVAIRLIGVLAGSLHAIDPAFDMVFATGLVALLWWLYKHPPGPPLAKIVDKNRPPNGRAPSAQSE